MQVTNEPTSNEQRTRNNNKFRGSLPLFSCSVEKFREGLYYFLIGRQMHRRTHLDIIRWFVGFLRTTPRHRLENDVELGRDKGRRKMDAESELSWVRYIHQLSRSSLIHYAEPNIRPGAWFDLCLMYHCFFLGDSLCYAEQTTCPARW